MNHNVLMPCLQYCTALAKVVKNNPLSSLCELTRGNPLSSLCELTRGNPLSSLCELEVTPSVASVN